MHIDAICETNGKGWLIWAAQCPGAFARGATENEALPSCRATCGASALGRRACPGTSPLRGRAHRKRPHTEDADSDLLLEPTAPR